MFEVGKKYKGLMTCCTYKCVFSGKEVAILENKDREEIRFHQYEFEGFEEIKSPTTKSNEELYCGVYVDHYNDCLNMDLLGPFKSYGEAYKSLDWYTLTDDKRVYKLVPM